MLFAILLFMQDNVVGLDIIVQYIEGVKICHRFSDLANDAKPICNVVASK